MFSSSFIIACFNLRFPGAQGIEFEHFVLATECLCPLLQKENKDIKKTCGKLLACDIGV